MTDELVEYLKEIEPKMRAQGKGLWAEGVKMAIARMEKVPRCLVCGSAARHPVLATLHHFRFYEKDQWKWLTGNQSLFGRWVGFLATCDLAFPFFNTLRHWRHRKCTLELPGGKPLASVFDSNGCAIRSHDNAGAVK